MGEVCRGTPCDTTSKLVVEEWKGTARSRVVMVVVVILVILVIIVVVAILVMLWW